MYTKKLISILTVLCLCCAMILPLNVMAEDNDDVMIENHCEDDNGLTLYSDPHITEEVCVVFEKTSDERVYNIIVKSNDGEFINRLSTADLTFAFTKQNEADAMDYDITAGDNINIIVADKDRYEFNFDGMNDVADGGYVKSVVIGAVKFNGYGKFSFKVAVADTNVIHTATDNNVVVDYIANGDVTAGEGVLASDATEIEDGDPVGTQGGTINSNLEPARKTLTINVTFPNAVEANAAAYQDMTVTVKGGSEAFEYVLSDAAVASASGAAAEIDMTGGAYVIEEALLENMAYNITVKGAGYRTAGYTVLMTDDKTVTFWNNVMDNDTYIEEGVGTASKTNFLAGDIVKDGDINIYDLSAVVSYFGMVDLNAGGTASDYAKYDLNRDGKIDSKDIAYVLVSWGY